MIVNISILSIHYLIQKIHVILVIQIVKNVKLQVAVPVYNVFILKRLLKDCLTMIIMVKIYIVY
jgi:hypothetical protein